MVCLCCHRPTSGRICAGCAGTIRSAPERILPGGIRLVAPFRHEGAAKQLIHLLKYRGVTPYARVVAEALSPKVPTLPLVPIPRAWSRKLRYGVDPALLIARELSIRNGAPVMSLLAPPIHSSRRAGRDHDIEVSPFRLRATPKGPVIVVDDVVTTGATIGAAVEALGMEYVALAVAANSVGRVSSLSPL